LSAVLLMHFSDFRYVACFISKSKRKNWNVVKNQCQIFQFFTIVKIRREVGEMSGSRFQAQSRSLAYYRCEPVAWTGICNTFIWPEEAKM